MLIYTKEWTKKYRLFMFRALVLIMTGLILPAIALSWPTNHLDNSAKGGKPYCISCHSYNSGYLTIETIRNKVPANNSVTVNRGTSFAASFRTEGLGYGRFTVSGAVLVPDTNKWILSSAGTGDLHTPWFVAKQTTIHGAASESPIIWSTNFTANDNPTGQQGVTPDHGLAVPFKDRNLLAHDEEFWITVTVGNNVENGTYQLKIWGIGTTSAGVLGYNEQVLEVRVDDDVNPPNTPVLQFFDGITASRINVKWNSADDNPGGSGINGYEVYRSKSSTGPFQYVGYVSAPDINFLDTELLASTTYYYKVAAVDNAGNVSPLSSIENATTLAPPRVDGAAPLTPVGLRAITTSHPEDSQRKVVQVTWNANKEDDIVGYYVYRSTSETGQYVAASNLVTTKTEHLIDADDNTVYYTASYLDTSVIYGTTYFYKVRAVDIVGKVSEMSSSANAVPAVDAGAIDPHGNYRDRQGMCQHCHSTHSARGKDLIYRRSITDSCYTCHDGSQSKYNAKASFDPVANPSHHRIPEGRYSCDACHNPHYSSEDNPKLLSALSREDGNIKTSADANYFCWACHGENSDLPNPFGRDHKTAFLSSAHNELTPKSELTQITCLNCHNAHGSRDYPLLVSSNSANFCILCHKESGFDRFQVLADDGSVLEGVYTRNFSNDYLGTSHEKNFYGRNTCTMCHEPHGHISNRYMLLEPYDDRFTTGQVGEAVYGPVIWENNLQENMLCFRCHDSQYYVGLGGNGNCTIGSRFGNGNARNLHDHVTDLNISCRACHDPHSGTSDFHEPGSTPESGWFLNNTHYMNFDWAKVVGIVSESAYQNRFAFIPAEGANNTEAGFSCALTCHGFDHRDEEKNVWKSYIRTNNSPTLKCAACHDFDKFDTNSRHPVLSSDPRENKLKCEQCHLEDHNKHTRTNPYGLRSTVVTNWTSAPSGFIETYLPTEFHPITGQEVPAYGKFCWQCHGAATGPDATRDVLGDKYTHFKEKPHSLLQREGKANPYVEGLDSPCLVCHTHHASSNVRLLRNVIDGVAIDAATDRGKINSCLACHDGSPGNVDIAKKYNAESSGGHFIKADPTKKLLCTECHCPHGSTNSKYMLDEDKYNTGVVWPANRNNKDIEEDPLAQTFEVKDFCLVCHPYSDATESIFYDTSKTLRVGVIEIKPMPDTVEDHGPGGRNCEICHDPHKPWPATGGADRCYDCHSRPNGEATDIKTLMGLASQPGSGLPSKHIITDADSVDNTCMQRCHLAHPHDPRSAHLKYGDEKTLCLSCHSDTLDPGVRAPYTINQADYEGKPHDYTKKLTPYVDNSAVLGNCDKCHTPHGSNFAPLLRQRKDDLCVSCHDGVTTDGQGKVIRDIKTMYNKAGHSYKDYPGAKLYCDECHVPHGSSNDYYLRDDYAPRQSITFNGNSVAFPSDLTGVNYNTREFCIVCHREYQEGITEHVYYESETTPGGQIAIASIPLIGANGVQIEEHRKNDPKDCTECHNAHDPEPVGNDKDCFVCHGATGYAYQIEPLTGLGGVFPGGQAKTSFHRIDDPDTQTINDCMAMCHTKHVHDPRSDVLVDRRPWSPANDNVPPAAPTNIVAEASSGNQVDLSFTASTSEDVFGYIIYKWKGSEWAKYGVVNSRALSPATVWFYDGGLAEGVEQRYRVVAFDRAGNVSDLSAAVEVTAAPSQAADTTPPEIPTNLRAQISTATGTATTRVVLSWSPSKDNYLTRKYNIYRSGSANGTYTLIGSTGNTAFGDAALQPEQTYYYKITALDAKGNESAMTAFVSMTTEALYAQITPGRYWFNTPSGRVEYELIRSAGNVFNNIFMNSGNMTVKIRTPHNYFGESLTQKKVELFDYAMNNQTGTPLKTISTVVPERLTAGDTYTWTVPLPDPNSNEPCSLYNARTTISDGSRTINASEGIIVAPTTKKFNTFLDAARTQQSVVFTSAAPNNTIYFEVSSDDPRGATRWERTISLRKMDGTVVHSTTSTADLSPSYDANASVLRQSYTLPGGLENDTWYILNVYAEVTRGRRNGSVDLTITDSYRQILVRVPDTTPPGQPGGITIGDKTPNSVQLSWTVSSGDPVGYNIYRKLSTEGTYILAGSVTGTNFTDTGLTNNTSYDYLVRAFDSSGNLSTAASVSNVVTLVNPVDTTPPNKPLNVRTQTDSADTVTIRWNPNNAMEGVTGYAIYRSVDEINFEKVGVTTGTLFTDDGLRSNTQYYYYVRAYDRAGNLSVPSDIKSRKTKRSGDESIEGALCMSCHDGATLPPYKGRETPIISTAYLQSKHNVDMPLFGFKDGSVYEGNCLKCHVAHGSDYGNLLRQEDNNELCFLCHTSASDDSKYSGRSYYEASSHGQTTATGANSTTPGYWPGWDEGGVPARTAAEAGRCYNCHAPHGRYDDTGEYIKASTWRGSSTDLNPLCYTCHSDSHTYGEYHGQEVYENTLHGNNALNSKMTLDSSYGQGECNNCHDPHGTPYPSMLRYPMNVAGANKNLLCLTCHDRPNILEDTGLFEGSAVYKNSAHGQKAKWYERFNDGTVYNKSSFLPGVCMNCHNSHGATTDGSTDGDKVIPKMLVMAEGRDSEICNKCHEDSIIKQARPSYPGFAAFQNSPHYDSPGALWPGGRYYKKPQSEVNRGKCVNCHDPHGTARVNSSGILENMPGAAFDVEEELCFTCHRAATPEEIAVGKSAPAATDIAQFRGRLNGHMPWVTSKEHSFSEDLNAVKRHVECQDCHNVHIVESTAGATTLSQRLAKALKGNWGVKVTSWPDPPTPNYNNAAWKSNPVQKTGYTYQTVQSSDPDFGEYMLCFKCHATYAPNSGGKRVIAYMNPKNASSHGWDPGRTSNTFQNPTINSQFARLFTAGTEFVNKSRTQVTCSDCHGNSDTLVNPDAPRGPHGSNQEYMLLRDYKSRSFCTACHSEAAYFPGGANTSYSRGSTVHNRAAHQAPSIIRNAGGAAPDSDELMNNFSARFGTNYCRYCHYAGHYMYSTEWISTHGSNGAWRYLPDNGGKALKGMNGYLIGRINFTASGGQCYAKDESGYYCGTSSNTRHSSAVENYSSSY